MPVPHWQEKYLLSVVHLQDRTATQVEAILAAAEVATALHMAQFPMRARFITPTMPRAAGALCRAVATGPAATASVITATLVVAPNSTQAAIHARINHVFARGERTSYV